MCHSHSLPLSPDAHVILTAVPPLALRVLVVTDPALVPRMREVDEQDELDEDEEEGADHADPHPPCSAMCVCERGMRAMRTTVCVCVCVCVCVRYPCDEEEEDNCTCV